MQVTVNGSCLCGSVKYEATGELQSFYYCHCQRCRKATGTGHASNIRVAPQTSVNWCEGEEFLARYKVPEAERFFNCFCTKCGSAMPRVVPELDAVVIPAGTLDCDLPLKPQARIFWDSRVEWSCDSGELPTYTEYVE